MPSAGPLAIGIPVALPIAEAPAAPSGVALGGELEKGFSQPAELESLHPTLWRAHQVGRAREAIFATGFAALDAALPGGGWPAGVLTELLLPHPGVGELRLLAPMLARLQRQQQARCLMWFDAPAMPSVWALQALGLSARQLVLVRSDPLQGMQGQPGPRGLEGHGNAGPQPLRHPVRHPVHAAAPALWALEHALKSGHVGAVLAWLPPRLPGDALRRLQLAAQGHEGPAFLLRHYAAARQASPAPLRLHLAAAVPDGLRITLLKRRGPPLAKPLLLQLAPVLAGPARARARAGIAAHAAAADAAAEASMQQPLQLTQLQQQQPQQQQQGLQA